MTNLTFPARKALKALAVASSLVLGAHIAAADMPGQTQITPPDDVQWFAMIPEMGDKGPQMAVLFGEPGKLGAPLGGLFRVPAGAVSPPHIHHSDYWAVMLSGIESAFDGDESNATPIPPGSWWYQPARDAHINKCMGPEDCVFFVYYSDGMDYHPVDPATYSSGE